MMTAHAHTEAICRHCGASYTSHDDDHGFCCRGCEYVHGMIHSGGYEKYYELKDRVTAPIGASVFS